MKSREYYLSAAITVVLGLCTVAANASSIWPLPAPPSPVISASAIGCRFWLNEGFEIGPGYDPFPSSDHDLRCTTVPAWQYVDVNTRYTPYTQYALPAILVRTGDYQGGEPSDGPFFPAASYGDWAHYYNPTVSMAYRSDAPNQDLDGGAYLTSDYANDPYRYHYHGLVPPAVALWPGSWEYRIDWSAFENTGGTFPEWVKNHATIMQLQGSHWHRPKQIYTATTWQPVIEDTTYVGKALHVLVYVADGTAAIAETPQVAVPAFIISSVADLAPSAWTHYRDPNAPNTLVTEDIGYFTIIDHEYKEHKTFFQTTCDAYPPQMFATDVQYSTCPLEPDPVPPPTTVVAKLKPQLVQAHGSYAREESVTYFWHPRNASAPIPLSADSMVSNWVWLSQAGCNVKVPNQDCRPLSLTPWGGNCNLAAQALVNAALANCTSASNTQKYRDLQRWWAHTAHTGTTAPAWWPGEWWADPYFNDGQ